MIRGLMYGLAFSIIGGLLGLLMKTSFLVGAYVADIATGCVAMMITAFLSIGSPRKRFQRIKSGDFKAIEASDKGPLYSGIIGVELVVIGLALEAFLH